MNQGVKKLRFLLCLTLLLSLFLTGCPGRKQSGGVDAQNILSKVELEVFQQINDYRSSQGLTPLEADERIIKQAREHSGNMAEGRVPFSHEGFDERVQKTEIELSNAAENVAYNKGYAEPATKAVEGWIKSEGHRHNIVGDFNLTGIGVIKNQAGTYYFTQLFIKTVQNEEEKDFFSQFRFW